MGTVKIKCLGSEIPVIVSRLSVIPWDFYPYSGVALVHGGRTLVMLNRYSTIYQYFCILLNQYYIINLIYGTKYTF